MNNKKSNFIIVLTIIIFSFIIWNLSSDYIRIFDVQNSKIITNHTDEITSTWKTNKNDFNSWNFSFWVNNLFLDKDLDLDVFWKVYNIIKTNYYSIDKVDKEKLVYGATKGMVDALEDKYTTFMVPDEAEKFVQMLSGDFQWIWAVINKNELWVEIDRVLKGSPAEKNGLLKWDIIIKAWDIDLEELSVYEAVEEIKWPAWSVITLTIFRSWESDLIVKDIIREKITIPSVEGESYELNWKNIWYIALNIFWEYTSKEFKIELNKLKDTDWLIIDLRNNWGWYLNSAIEILSEFVDNDKLLVTTKYRDSSLNKSYYSQAKWWIYNKPIVIIINWNSASASEITAGTLRDYNLAMLVWEKSYGKWSVQEPIDDLNGWSQFNITIARWYTPKDRNIDLEWIEPDIEVNFEKEDYENMYDRQLEEAKKILEKFIDLKNIQLVVDEYEKNKEETSTGVLDEVEGE